MRCHKKLHQFVLGLLLGLLMSGCGGVEGVFLNGDFETGTLKFWSADSGATIVETGDESHVHAGGATHDHDGSHAGQFGATGSAGMLLVQAIGTRLEPGVTYELSAWIKVTVAGAGVSAPALRVSREPQLGLALSEAKAANAVALGWQKLTLALAVAEEDLAQPLYAGVTCENFAGIVVVDDFAAATEAGGV
ncbi:MAG: carbohydrate binding domain-containing protein [Myxococcaceae bacterium]